MSLDHAPWLKQYARFCDCNTDCRCGEGNACEWVWDKKHATRTATLSNHDLEVSFNNGYSNGTAAARGNKLLEKGRHHYWEIKMITAIYGTDVMVGVGTSKVDLNKTTDTFCSLLGLDQESFGFSYKACIQHAGEKRAYGSCFGQGSLVGIHLDTWRGTLQFFLNRNPLGIAFTGLRDIMLYPMVSSTAAHSKMRLTYSCSIPASLQTECLAVLRPQHRAYLSAMFPGLRHLSQSIFADVLKKDLDDTEDEQETVFPEECILDDYDFVLVGLQRKKKRKYIKEDCPMAICENECL